jgi:serine/threonine protein kinase
MSDYPLALPIGSIVDGLRIEKVLGQGAFGVTYLAADVILNTRFALKEYLPREKATRVGSEIRPS